MAQVDAEVSRHYVSDSSRLYDEAQVSGHSHEAYRLLHLGFVILPTLAGLDKFFHLLTNRDEYVAPVVGRLLPLSVHAFMMTVGAAEIATGLLVLFRPRVGAYVVAVGLVGIIVDLVAAGGYLDAALRNVGLGLGALALARLSLGEKQTTP